MEVGLVAFLDDAPTSLALSADQQAEVMRVVAAAAVPPEEFTWAVQPSRYHIIGPLVSALVHTPSAAAFRFEFLESVHGMNRVSVFTPCSDALEVTRSAASWEQQLEHVREWLAQLREDGA